METLTLYGTAVSIALFSRLANAPQIKARLVAASTLADDEAGDAERTAVEFAFVDAATLSSRLHLLTAVSQALLAQSDHSLRTKTVQSEVLWALSPGANISESLKYFGISPATTSLVLIHFSVRDSKALDGGAVNEGAVYGRMKAVVEGELASLELLGTPAAGVNLKALRKLYKLNLDAALANVKVGSEGERRAVDDLCVGAVALKVVT